MNQGITTNDQAQLPVSAEDIKNQSEMIKGLIGQAMKKGTHYDTIPGTDKMTLLKAGTEKIMSMFRLAPKPEVEDLSTPDSRAYRVTCSLYSPSGMFLGAGLGSCSTDENKYKWRAAVCEDEFEDTEPARRRVKWYRNRTKSQQVRTEPADLDNTVLKMAKKRALADAILTVTAASDVFTQDDDGGRPQGQPQTEPRGTPTQQMSEAADEYSTGQASPDDVASGKQIGLIKHRLADKGLTTADLADKWPNGIQKRDVDHILEWIKEQPAK